MLPSLAIRQPLRFLTSTTKRRFTASSTVKMASPFTNAVASSMRALYPEVLADKSFDNTGLLLEAPFFPSRRNRNSVLLTIDLTKAVAEEAIRNKHSAIVAYHPIIFRPLKFITLADPQQQSLLRLAAKGISVYSPHTAVDIVPNGMADWLCDIVTGKLDAPEPEAFSIEEGPKSDTAETFDATKSETDLDTDTETDDTTASQATESTVPTTPNQSIQHTKDKDSDVFDASTPKPTVRPKRPGLKERAYSKPLYPTPTPSFHPAALSHSRSIITPSPTSAIEAANTLTNSSTYSASNTGAGRLITFSSPQPLTLLITRIAHAIGLPKGFPVAIPQDKSVEEIDIKTVGVCPGSGGSVISAANENAGSGPDLVFTGELSHHDALAVTERGGSVISLFHSNSERGYLHSVLQPQLSKHLKAEWEKTRTEMKSDAGGKNGWSDGIEEILEDESVDVVVSGLDRDPFGIVVLVESTVEGVDVSPRTDRK